MLSHAFYMLSHTQKCQSLGQRSQQFKIMSSEPQDETTTENNTDSADVPIPTSIHLVWDSPHIHEFVDFGGSSGWKCGHCFKSWKGKNHTKALTHLTGVGKDIAPCKGRIPDPWRQLYASLLKKKAEMKGAKILREKELSAELDARDNSTVEHLLAKQGRRSNASLAASSQTMVDLCDSPEASSTNERAITSVAQPSKKKPKLFQTNIVVTGGKNNPEAERNLDVAISHFILANCLPLVLSECELFQRVLVCARQTNNKYKAPSRYKVGGHLLDATYASYASDERKKLDIDAEKYGIAVYGDGATIKTVPLINVLAAGVHNPGCVLDIVDCTEHMSEGGIKDADYISREMIPLMKSIDPEQKKIDLILFDGAGNVQKAGNIMSQYFPRATVSHCPAHVISLIFDKVIKLQPYNDLSRFCKIVSTREMLCVILCNHDFNISCLFYLCSLHTAKKHLRQHSTWSSFSFQEDCQSSQQWTRSQFYLAFGMQDGL
jgi:hypothetical protein